MDSDRKAEERLKKLRFHLKLLNAPILAKYSSRGTPYLSFTLHTSKHVAKDWRIYYRSATKSYEFKGNYPFVGESIVRHFRTFA